METLSQFLIPILEGCWDHSLGNGGKVGTKSSARRWIKNQSVHVNGFPVECNEPLDFPIFSIVLFPKNRKRKTTLW
jgi:hypothetical protein